MARKQPPQVDRNRHLHGLSAASNGNLFRLQVIDCLHHRRAQKLRHRDPVLLRAGLDLRDAEHHRDEVHIPVGLRRAAQVPSGRLLAAGLYIARIAKEAVFQLLLVGLLKPSENAVLRRNVEPIFFA